VRSSRVSTSRRADGTNVRRAFAAAVAILTAYNVVRGLGAFGRFEDAAAVGLAITMLGVARYAGLGLPALGLARSDLRRGARYGMVALAVVSAVLVVAATIPATSGFLEDERADVSFAGIVFAVVVSELVVTVIPEELAFRGVLLGAGNALWSEGRATLLSSALFGLWHISPTLGTMSSNHATASAAASATGAAAVVLGTVAATFVAGMIFCWLRLRSRSLLAPVLAHLATNGAALLVAWFVVHAR
jgi:membrane protease YdiL (CAAX protease family)